MGTCWETGVWGIKAIWGPQSNNRTGPRLLREEVWLVSHLLTIVCASVHLSIHLFIHPPGEEGGRKGGGRSGEGMGREGGCGWLGECRDEWMDSSPGPSFSSPFSFLSRWMYRSSLYRAVSSYSNIWPGGTDWVVSFCGPCTRGAPTPSGPTQPTWKTHVFTKCVDAFKRWLDLPDTIYQQWNTHACEECTSLWSESTGKQMG